MTAPLVQGESAPTLGALLRRPLAWTIGLSVAMNLQVFTPALFMLQVFDRVLVSLRPETLVVSLAGARWRWLYGSRSTLSGQACRGSRGRCWATR